MAKFIITDKEREKVQSTLGRLLVGDPTLQLMRPEFKADLRAAATILQTLSPAEDPVVADLDTRPRRRAK